MRKDTGVVRCACSQDAGREDPHQTWRRRQRRLWQTGNACYSVQSVNAGLRGLLQEQH